MRPVALSLFFVLIVGCHRADPRAGSVAADAATRTLPGDAAQNDRAQTVDDGLGKGGTVAVPATNFDGGPGIGSLTCSDGRRIYVEGTNGPDCAVVADTGAAGTASPENARNVCLPAPMRKCGGRVIICGRGYICANEGQPTTADCFAPPRLQRCTDGRSICVSGFLYDVPGCNAPPRPPPPKPAPSCDPAFTIDARGTKTYKAECVP